MRRWVLAAVPIVALALGGCGDDTASTTGQASSTSAIPTTVETAGGTGTDPISTPTNPSAGETTGYHIWFTKGGKLQPMWIESQKTLGVLTESMKLLLAGPPAGSGLETEIPDGVEVRDLGFANGTATVDLSRPPVRPGAAVLPVGQIVYTLTQYPTVKRVRITMDGAGLGVGGTSVDIFRRGPFWEEYLPAIVVLAPTGLAPVTSPLTVSGTADVFEANVTIKVLDAGGKELASTFTTATCGTGCRGTFAKRVEFDAETGDEVTLVLQDDDADGDGKPAHEVRIPLEVG